MEQGLPAATATRTAQSPGTQPIQLCTPFVRPSVTGFAGPAPPSSHSRIACHLHSIAHVNDHPVSRFVTATTVSHVLLLPSPISAHPVMVSHRELKRCSAARVLRAQPRPCPGAGWLVAIRQGCGSRLVRSRPVAHMGKGHMAQKTLYNKSKRELCLPGHSQ